MQTAIISGVGPLEGLGAQLGVRFAKEGCLLYTSPSPRDVEE